MVIGLYELLGNSLGPLCIRKMYRIVFSSNLIGCVLFFLWIDCSEVSLLPILYYTTYAHHHWSTHWWWKVHVYILHMSAELNFSFMVHWFSLFPEKYFTQTIFRGQTRHRSVYTCDIYLYDVHILSVLLKQISLN